MIDLKPGLVTVDGSLLILDEDRLCYQVLSQSHSAKGVRTISKNLLDEWIEAVQANPGLGAGELRTMLCGKSEVDKFEYGYFATLKKMAEMALGRVEVTIPEADLSNEFVRWFTEHRGKKNTAEKYLGYFKTLTDPYQEPTNSYWHGLYRVIYERDAEKQVVSIGTARDFERIYGDFISALEKKIKGAGMSDSGFEKAVEWFWRPEVKSHTCVTSALNAYREFLAWRGQPNTQSLKALVDSGVRFWTYAPGAQASYWNDVVKDKVIALSYKEVGDFSKLGDKDAIAAAFAAAYGDDKEHPNCVRAVLDFRDVMKPGDYVFAKKGMSEFVGVGRVTGEFFYDESKPEYPDRRTIEWLKVESRQIEDKADRKTLTNITPYFDFVDKLWRAYGLDEVKQQADESDPENLLDFALHQFKAHRSDPEWAGNRGENDWTSWSVNTATREYYGKLDAETVHAFTTEQFAELFCGVKNEEGKITFSPMWSGCPGQGWNSVKEGYESDPQEVISFLEDIAKSPAMLALFARDDFNRPKGFGKSVISELLMKFHPDCCFKYGSKTVEVLKKLGLLDFVPHSDYKDTEYKRVLGIAATIKDKMTALKISRTLEDSEKPDYLTVNEFIGWVFDQEDELFKIYKEKVMSKKLKTDKPTPYEGKKELKFNPKVKDDELLLRLLSSLRAKPFAILAGHSGTGKSRYVKKLAYMTCNAHELRTDGKLPGNFLLLQVKPNWHDSTELLGIRNAMDENRYQRTALIEFLFKAYHFKETPFFLCLDEMNLAPVEQYFAEFLSSMESEEPVPLNDIKADEDNLFELGCEWTDAQEYVKTNGFSIPKNLFIVGTVNMDETTNQFSRKVLDRAFTIEMTDVDFTNFGVVTKPSYEDTISEVMIKALLAGEKSVTKLDSDDVADGSALVKVQKALEQTAFAVAYRFASEYTLLKRAIKLFDPENTMKLDPLDQAVLMKVLPRIAGEADYIRKFVYGKTANEGLRKALEGKKMSLDKIAVILKRAEETDAQSITFWP